MSNEIMQTRIKVCKEIAEKINLYLEFVESAGNEDAWCDRIIESIKESAAALPEFEGEDKDAFCCKCGEALPKSLTMTLIDKTGSKIYCPNCIVEAACNDELKLEPDDNLVCDITGKHGAVRFTDLEETYTLNTKAMRRLLAHSLSPKEYITLSQKYDAANYMLHDDFYDPETGLAVQAII